MNMQRKIALPETPSRTNGSGAAAVLATGLGSFTLAVLALVADKSAPLKGLLNFYKPTGPLSGVTTLAILGWLLAWALLELRWRQKTVAVTRICALALLLLGLSLVLTFPPVVDLF
jgi:hypothetical protein